MKRILTLLLVVICWQGCQSTFAKADTTLGTDAAGKLIFDYRASADYKQLLDKAVGQIPEVVFKRCPKLKTAPIQVYFLAPFTTDSAGKPKSGKWKESYGFSGCGNTSILNFIFEVKSDQHIALTTALPGESRSAYVLQMDTLPNVQAAVRIKIKTPCDDLAVVDTVVGRVNNQKVVRFDPATVLASKPWTEVWTVGACGRKLFVPIQFIPDATGTSFSIVATDIVVN